MGRVLAALCSLVLAGCLDAPTGGGGDGDAGGGGDGGVVTDVPGPTDGLLAYWSMDSLVDDSILPDSVGGHDAVCLRCPVPDEGRVGGGMWFSDEAYAYIEWPSYARAYGTISAWVYVEEVPSSVVLARPYVGDVGDGESVLLGTLSGSAFFEYTGGYDTSGALLEPNSWNHLAGTWTPDERVIYLNGTIQAFEPQVTYWDDSNFYIGCDYDFGADTFHWVGAIDDLRLYGRALAPTEVGEILDL